MPSTRAVARVAVAAGVALVVGCVRHVATTPHPLESQFRYTCCNLHYVKDEITDANYLRGDVLPLGTRVRIVEVRKDRVRFEVPGHATMTLVFRGDDERAFDVYLDRIFVADDPYARLPKLADTGQERFESDRLRRAIEEGDVEPGMTRAQVLLALGYPPADRTPSLDAPKWTYLAGRDDAFEVYFEGDAVARVHRDPPRDRRRRRMPTPW
jgi:hypothetical protein